jgi:ABC-type multidrug transport system ATPase subunit
VLCALFNMRNPRPFGSPPVGWRRLFDRTAWRSAFGRVGCAELAGVDVAGVRKVYGGRVDLAIRSGKCVGAGKSICVEMRAYHAIVSVVFQDNALIPNYTAREHLQLFGRLCGNTDFAIQQSVDAFVSLFKTRDFIDNASENLSGGSKRQLCLAVVKDPRVLVCDEPCAGMDIEARQLVWRAISSHAEMTSFVNAHSIDKTESMRSRSMVMSQGRA